MDERGSSWLNSQPSARFEAQVQLEMRRLEELRSRPEQRQTLPYDPNASLRANAEFNVQQRWWRLGMWRTDWGSRPLSPSRAGITVPLDMWAHELSNAPGSSASRPYQQFMVEVSGEMEWLIDGMECVLGHAMVESAPCAWAFRNVRSRWINDGIWSPFWRGFPGNTWLHEIVNKGGRPWYFNVLSGQFAHPPMAPRAEEASGAGSRQGRSRPPSATTISNATYTSPIDIPRASSSAVHGEAGAGYWHDAESFRGIGMVHEPVGEQDEEEEDLESGSQPDSLHSLVHCSV
jgi:hypothetical protein